MKAADKNGEVQGGAWQACALTTGEGVCCHYVMQDHPFSLNSSALNQE